MASESIENAVRELAYAKWEQAGRPAGDGVDYWLEAESEICQASVTSPKISSTRGSRSEAAAASPPLKLAKPAGGARRAS
ncbi:DUF2934 domain-containing protein [Schlesneria paludicola]|uniref:DUF2934 domain-containing protein n=1 Tax=Schlesneria paludicola TaxID=360056 RepID=UPI00029A44FA|nr:DUF2934 domain-containing protein [Schlesneria paludicola]